MQIPRRANTGLSAEPQKILRFAQFYERFLCILPNGFLPEFVWALFTWRRFTNPVSKVRLLMWPYFTKKMWTKCKFFINKVWTKCKQISIDKMSLNKTVAKMRKNILKNNFLLIQKSLILATVFVLTLWCEKKPLWRNITRETVMKNKRTVHKARTTAAQ